MNWPSILSPLSAAQAQRRFQYLREELRGRYGEPVQESTRMPRDTSNLARRAAKHEELARQYDAEISAGEERLNHPMAGAMFAIRGLGVRGVPEPLFAG